MRSHALKAAVVLVAVLPAIAGAASVTDPFSYSYSVTANGVSPEGITNTGRFVFVGGSSTSTTNVDPSFAVYQVNGAAVLASLQTASGVAGGTVSSINGLSINLPDETTYGGNPTEVAGSLVFSYAPNTTALTVQSATPVFDSTQVGGLSTQLGALDPLGTGTYTPVALNTYTDFPLSGTAGFTDITNAIDSGSTFYIAVAAGTSTTQADFGGYYGLSPYLAAANLTVNATVSPVPEPASLGLLGTCGLMLLGRRRRQVALV
jgi:hypothetical protein